MGGLIARYWLEVEGGWRDCRALITLGTPHRGSVQALSYLANGYRKLVVDLTEVMRSMTSVHQLLPIYPAVLTEGT
jgi:triacylglycerol esterase/lipase EstA (alpha/beta hydrolase family)